MTGMQPPWGALTGIRPTRLLYEALDTGMQLPDAMQHVQREFDVSADRAGLLAEIAEMQAGIRVPARDSYDLYIGIPFCRTRCSYCSFSSGEIGRNRKLLLRRWRPRPRVRPLHRQSRTSNRQRMLHRTGNRRRIQR